jgi:hypothetical protein
MTLVVDSTIPVSFSYGNPETVSVGASPFVLSNIYPFIVTAIIMGGTVSLIEFQGATWKDAGTWLPTPGTAGRVTFRPGDSLRITYSVAPTINWFPT